MSFHPSTLPDLAGRVYLVTGGNRGIGKATVFHLAKKNAKVYMGARSKSKADTAVAEIKQQVPTAQVEVLIMDLMDLESIVSAAKKLSSKESQLNGMVNNAGIMAVPFKKTRDGYESQWQTNYVSHWLLTKLLLPLLLSTAQTLPPGTVRVIDISSVGHKLFAPTNGINFDDIDQNKGGPQSRYGQSKLGNILHSKELLRRYGPGGTELTTADRGIWTASIHPGNIDTQLNTVANGFAAIGTVMVPIVRALGMYDTADTGAFSSLFAVASPEFSKDMNGKYLIPVARIGTPSKDAENPALATRLWDWTEDQMKSKGFL